MKSKSTIGIVIVLAIILVIAGTFWLGGNNFGSRSGSKPINNPPSSIQPSNTNTNTASNNEVTLEGFAFSPLELKIKKGSTVTWTNQDSVKHTVTSDSGSELSSALIKKGETYSNVFNELGTFSYHCTPHPSMKAKIIVE